MKFREDKAYLVRIKAVPFAILSFLLLIFPTLPLWANQIAGTDFIYLIDQSGSMSKGGVAAFGNDHMGKRATALQSMRSHLMQSAKSGFVNRISVIEFGGRFAVDPEHKPQVTVSRLEIPPGIGVSDIDIRDKIIKGLAPVVAGFRGDTDTAKALELALQEQAFFINNPVPSYPGAKFGERKQIVMLITDGAPYAAQLNSLVSKGEIKGNISALKASFKDLFFIVVAINDDKSDYWENYWGDFWTEQATKDPLTNKGHGYLVPTNMTAGEIIRPLLMGLIEPAVETTLTNSFTVPPYLKALDLTIDFFQRGLGEQDIEIIDPEGNKIAIRSIYPDYATTRINYPIPGAWQFHQQGSNDELLYQVQANPVYEGVTLKSPLLAVNQHQDIDIKYELEGQGEDGAYIPSTTWASPDFSLQVTSPSGKQEQLVLHWDDNQQLLVGQRPFRVHELGDYRLLMVGKVMSQSGSMETVYRSLEIVQVMPGTPIRLQMVEPGNTIVLQDGRADDVTVAFELKHASTGANLNIGEAMTSTPLSLSLLLEGKANIDSPVSLRPFFLNPVADQLVAKINVDYGTTQYANMFRNGRLRFSLSPLDNTVFKPGYVFIDIANQSAPGVSQYVNYRESLWGLRYPLLVFLGAIILAVFVVYFWYLPNKLRSSDRKLKRKPTLTLQCEGLVAAEQWTLTGKTRISGSPRIKLPGDITWQIEKFQIKRSFQTGKQVRVSIRYREMNESDGKRKTQTVVLYTSNNAATTTARRRVSGLPGNMAAEFILKAGYRD